ncbi:hypothetical protein SSX86_010138 [Deinandra increscens subsp. villosa]|uniref:Avr9/Cf-9 rapidly elicited protein n=1 Tax=Deinandra increscens subsp. villosa TaxID=3103831 RepID=A0AAP0DEK4_9ASTR
MEQNQPILAKKLWSLMRVMFFLLKKNISKTKFFSDLNTMLSKRSKIAGKSLHNLLFHHHHHHHPSAVHRHPHHLPFPTPPPSDDDDDEFSCTTTPQNPLSIISPSHKNHRTHASPPCVDNIVEMLTTAAAASPGFGVGKELRITDSPLSNISPSHKKHRTQAAPPCVDDIVEMLTTEAAASPGFGVGKELRITDSPFPLSNGDGDGKVDEAADRFIMRFYNSLRGEE